MNDYWKSIYDLKLHEVVNVEYKVDDCLFTTVMRVPGGLIYRSYDKGHDMMAAVFVPFIFETNDFGNAGGIKT